MRKNKLVLAFFIAILVYSVPVFANPFSLIPSTIGNFSSVIWNIAQNDMALMGIMFLFYTMLLTAIFKIGINAIPSFKDSPQARSVSIILAIMSASGLLFLSRSNPRLFIERTIVPLGIFGILFVAGGIFFMINNLAKNSDLFKYSKWKLQFIAIGISLLMAGWILRDIGPWTRNLVSWGMLLLTIGLIATVWGFGMGRTGNRGIGGGLGANRRRDNYNNLANRIDDLRDNVQRRENRPPGERQIRELQNLIDSFARLVTLINNNVGRYTDFVIDNVDHLNRIRGTNHPRTRIGLLRCLNEYRHINTNETNQIRNVLNQHLTELTNNFTELMNISDRLEVDLGFVNLDVRHINRFLDACNRLGAALTNFNGV